MMCHAPCLNHVVVGASGAPLNHLINTEAERRLTCQSILLIRPTLTAEE